MKNVGHFDQIAQLISDNSSLGTALQKYGISQIEISGSLEEALKNSGLDGQFMWDVLCALDNPREFSPDTFNSYPLPLLLEYLRKTHTYYNDKRLGEIEQGIENIQKKYIDKPESLYWEMIDMLFSAWKRHLQLHIEQEERVLFPYVEKLVTAQEESASVLDTFSLSQFVHHHEDDQLEDGLKEICNSVRKHSSGLEELPLSQKVLLTQLNAFETDLWVHSLMEDNVLIPRAQKIEEHVRP